MRWPARAMRSRGSRFGANGMVLVAGSRQQAMEWTNRIAPEHLTVDARRCRGGHATRARSSSATIPPQSAGDYAAGPNHVLPTAAVARFRGGLSVLDFVKIITVQE